MTPPRSRAWFFAAAIVLFPALFVSRSGAQNTPAPPISPHYAQFDDLLARARYAELNAAMAEEFKKPGGRGRVFDWQRDHVLYRGTGGTFVTMHYAQLLWFAGETDDQTVPRAEMMRQGAGHWALYAFQLIVLDGTKCADTTAPVARRDQFIPLARPSLKHLASLPEDQKEKIVAASITREKGFAAIRRNDDYLCRGGMEELGQALDESGMADKEVRPAPNGTRELVLPPARSYQPRFLEPEVWQSKQAALRQSIRPAIVKLLDALK